MLDWFANKWNEFVDFMWRLVLSFADMLKDFFIWIFETIMTGVISLIDGLASLLDGLAVAGHFGALPPETAHMLSQLGLTEAMGMIITALTVRFILQLIPLVRLGS
jgi:hypothetical protein